VNATALSFGLAYGFTETEISALARRKRNFAVNLARRGSTSWHRALESLRKTQDKVERTTSGLLFGCRVDAVSPSRAYEAGILTLC